MVWLRVIFLYDCPVEGCRDDSVLMPYFSLVFNDISFVFIISDL